MEPEGQLAESRMIESLTSWWELAGVDAAVGEMAVNWLAVDAKVETAEPLPRPTAVVKKQSTAIVTQSVDWPSDIETLKAMIGSGAPLPGNNFGPCFVKPVGIAGSEVMIISDLPDQDEAAGKMLGSGATGVLLERMLQAIGIKLADCYWTALATTIPSTGDLPDEVLGDLAGFIRHQISLVAPKSFILLGSTACRALLNDELMTARSELRNINHNDSNMAALTTFHPRTLIARPAMKAQAWKDLQMFTKRAGL